MRISPRVVLAVTLATGIAFPTFASPAAAETVIAQAQQTVLVTGRVRSAAATPIATADVSIAGDGVHESTKTNGSGTFSFKVPPGIYTITVNKGGYQSATTDIVVAAATPLTIAVSLTEADLSNLRVIGKTGTTSTKNSVPFNTSSSAQTTLSAETIGERDPGDLTQLLGELPGVQISTIGTSEASTSATPNKNLSIDGFSAETKTLIDGHPVSSGVFGAFLTQFLDSGLIQSVDVAKGAGLNGATAGQSAIGTVNFRTYEFTPNDSGFIRGGLDSYGGSFYSILADVNFGRNNRISVIAGDSVHGYNGPTSGFLAPNYDYEDSPSSSSPEGIYTPQIDTGLINGLFDDSDTNTLQSQLVKVRYKFSDATSLQFGFLGAQGRYNPQGGSYADIEGYVTVAPCTNSGSIPANGAAGCVAASTYNAPWANSLIGQTVPGYNLFPGSNVTNNNPTFNAELRTTYKNDTIFFRPYIAVVNRYIDGSGEANTPGNGIEIGSTDYDGFYEVTNPANCTVQFQAPNANGAHGPCFASNAALGSIPYVVNPNVPHTFASQSTSVPNCSVATPCFTTGTLPSNAGNYGYGIPYNQPELDRLNGYTFTYIHPFGANNATLQFDHFMDDTQKDEGDTEALGGMYAGCYEVVSSTPVANPQVGSLGYQSCLPVGAALPLTPVQIPETVVSQGDLSLDLQFALSPKVQFDFGNYFTLYRAYGQVENPNLIAEYAIYGRANPTWSGSTGIAPLDFVQSNATYAHYDPHFGFVFRPTRDISIRATAGSSISTPYASQLSGLTKVTLATQASTTGYNVITEPNPALKPEETVAFNLGTDIRMKTGAVASVDFFDDGVHNAWQDYTAVIPTPENLPEAPNGTEITEYRNVALHTAQGVDASIASRPAIGFGYSATFSLLRSYFLNLPAVASGSTSYPYDGEQNSGTAYSKGYASVQYAGVANSLIRLGIEYNGPNNSYYVPAFYLFDATLRLRVANKHTYFQLSANNISNVNLNTFLSAGTYAEGNNFIEQTYTDGAYTYGTSHAQDIYAVPFKTIKASLNFAL